MYQTNLDKRSLRSVLLLGAASAAAISLSAPAFAQDQETETVVVTGSRIPQQGLYSPSPVTAVGQQEMKFEGTTGVETLLNNLPSVFAEQTSGVTNGATGTATVDLRGLGPQRTLVLVNGTRLAPGDPVEAVPDLNTIPAALVDHVEVLTGGASAVYGSDALAGVVNFVMRKDFEGIEVDGQYGIAEADNTNSTDRSIVSAAGDQLAKENIWDAANETGTLIVGTNTANGKGNVTAYLGFENTEPVLENARDFSACSFNNSSSNMHFCGGSSTFDRITSLDVAAVNAAVKAGVPPPGGTNMNDDFFVQGNGTAGHGTLVPFTGASNQLYNYGATNYLQRPDTRYNGGFFAHYQVNKELELYTSFMFTDDHTVEEGASRGLFHAVGAISGTSFAVNCGNPLLSAGEVTALCNSNAQVAEYNSWVANGSIGPQPGMPTCTPVANIGNCNEIPGNANVEIGRRALEAGPFLEELRHTTYRMQVGARGDLGDGWNYDVYAQYSTAVFAKSASGYLSTSRAAQALQATGTAANPVCISGPPCVPLDVFSGVNPFGSITPAQLAFLKVPALQEGYTEEQIVSGSLTGDLGEYGIQSPWAKSPVAISIGSEYRAEYLQLTPDEEYQDPPFGDLNGAGGATVATPRSGFNVVEGFTELKIPLVQEKPFAEDLSFNAGYRYSSYSTSGSVSAYKYGAEWQPIDDFRVRASYERAVRAPNVLEAFQPANLILFTGQDPCASTAAGNCAGVPNAGTSLLKCSAGQCQQQVSGTATLKPEIGDTRSIGVVFTPTFLDGFTATVDYFDIDVSNAIGIINPNVTLGLCYGAGAAPVATNPYCAMVDRNSSGQIFGNGFVSAHNVNTGFNKTKGFDFEGNYNWSMDDWSMTQGYGSLQFAFVGTWLQSFVTEPVQGGGTYDCAGLYGTTCSLIFDGVPTNGPLPKWRHRLRVTWATPWDVDFSANWRFIGGTKLESETSNPLLQDFGPSFADPVDRTINDIWYLDLAGDWAVRTGVSIHAGVNNVFDRLPPTLSSFVLPVGPGNGNTFPGTYDALGRTFFVGATIKY